MCSFLSDSGGSLLYIGLLRLQKSSYTWEMYLK